MSDDFRDLLQSLYDDPLVSLFIILLTIWLSGTH
jgi:hypothetical protein